MSSTLYKFVQLQEQPYILRPDQYHESSIVFYLTSAGNPCVLQQGDTSDYWYFFSISEGFRVHPTHPGSKTFAADSAAKAIIKAMQAGREVLGVDCARKLFEHVAAVSKEKNS